MIPPPKFYVDDIVCSESGQPVLIGQLVAIKFFSNCLQMTDKETKKSQRSNVINMMNLLKNSFYS